MRNFKKIMALAISTAAICTSVSAFAELEYNVEGDFSGEYTSGTNSLSLTVDGAGAAGDKTVLVLADGVAATAATGNDILYINQYADGEAAFAGMGLKGTDALPAGEYAIKVGYTDANGDFAIAEGKLVVSEKENETVEVKFVLGDVDADDKAGLTDANYILAYLGGGASTIAPSTYAIDSEIAGGYILGDVDADDKAGLTDANYILAYLGGGAATIAPSTDAIDSEITVLVPAN